MAVARFARGIVRHSSAMRSLGSSSSLPAIQSRGKCRLRECQKMAKLGPDLQKSNTTGANYLHSHASSFDIQLPMALRLKFSRNAAAVQPLPQRSLPFGHAGAWFGHSRRMLTNNSKDTLSKVKLALPSPKAPKESAIVASVPLLHKLVEKAKSDPGNVVMNLGAVLSLSGFMMSDVMHLRALSICGSMCGIAFNVSRKPPQYNACMWGLVFVAVNMYHVYYLYLERTDDMTFHHDEMLLYTSHFKEWGVEPWQFKKLVKLNGCRFRTYKRGDVIVNAEQKLDDVMMVVRGEIGVEDGYKDHPPLSQKPMYTYRGDGRNGCVVGGTALVDPNVRRKKYPNRLVCEVDDTVVVKWDTDKLAMVMQTDKDIESAVLHALYTELIQGLRRDRQKKKEDTDTAERMCVTLLEYERLISNTVNNAAAEKHGFVELNPADKRKAREFAGKNGITLAQREQLVWKHGWTMDQWHDGAKEIDLKVLKEKEVNQ